MGEFGGAPYRDEGIRKAFEYHGCEVFPFGTQKYYNRSSVLFKKYSNLKKKYLFGSENKKMKNDLINFIKEKKPDVVFFRDVLLFSHLDWRDIMGIGNHLNICNVQTDMFSQGHDTYAWDQFRLALQLFDIHFVFREKNITDFQSIGFDNAYLWEPSFLPWYHKTPIKPTSNNDLTEAVFVGHFENDGREQYCRYLYENEVNIKIYSTNWKHNIKKSDSFYSCLYDPIYVDGYPKVIYDSIASLCFFSRLNNDKLTERVFEIPAMGGLLLSERNDRLQELFEEDKEILLFSNRKELLDQVLFVKENPTKAEEIRKAGRKKVLANHSIYDRTESALNIMTQFLNNNSVK